VKGKIPLSTGVAPVGKLQLRSVPDYNELMQDIDDALEGEHRSHFLKLIWERLFEDVPASHLRLQLKEKGSNLDSENEHTKIVIQTGQTIQYLADETSMSGFEDIEKLKCNDT
jgi:hypothetical protein